MSCGSTAALIDEDVERLPALGHGGGEAGDGIGLGQIERRDGRVAAGRVDAFLDRFERLGVARGEHDMRARRGQRLGASPRRSPGSPR